MEVLGSIFTSWGAIIAEAQKSAMGLAALIVLTITAISLVSLHRMPRKYVGPASLVGIVLLVMSVVWALPAFVLFANIPKPPSFVYTAEVLQHLKKVDFKVPYRGDDSVKYTLYDGRLERQSGDEWQETQDRIDGGTEVYRFNKISIAPPKIYLYRQNVEAYVDFSQREMCFRELSHASQAAAGDGSYQCPYAVIDFE